MPDVATIIRRARTGADLSQAELAARAGTSQPALARYETGATVPTLPTLERLLFACGRRLRLDAVPLTEPSAPTTSVRGQLGPRAAELRRHRRRLRDAARAHGVRRVRVFGSLARGEALPTSDVDLLVELEAGRTLLDLAAFRREARHAQGTHPRGGSRRGPAAVSRNERERLRDIKDAIVAIRDHLAGAGEELADKDAALLHDALLFQFVVIGEAVKHLTTDTRESAPEIPWADVAGLRDLIAHEYFRIEIDRVLAVVERDLPPLEQAIDRLLAD